MVWRVDEGRRQAWTVSYCSKQYSAAARPRTYRDVSLALCQSADVALWQMRELIRLDRSSDSALSRAGHRLDSVNCALGHADAISPDAAKRKGGGRRLDRAPRDRPGRDARGGERLLRGAGRVGARHRPATGDALAGRRGTVILRSAPRRVARSHADAAVGAHGHATWTKTGVVLKGNTKGGDDRMIGTHSLAFP
jgi:hypothetical protein